MCLSYLLDESVVNKGVSGLRRVSASHVIYYGPFQGGTSVVLAQYDILLWSCVYGLQQYGYLNSSCTSCFLFCSGLYFKIENR